MSQSKKVTKEANEMEISKEMETSRAEMVDENPDQVQVRTYSTPLPLLILAS